jgi:hypothetical protein
MPKAALIGRLAVRCVPVRRDPDAFDPPENSRLFANAALMRRNLAHGPENWLPVSGKTMRSNKAS